MDASAGVSDDSARTGIAGGTFWLLALIASIWLGAAAAQDDDGGHFEIVRAGLDLKDGIYYLNALATLDLSADGRSALESGVPLGISYELEFLNRLRLWWDIEEVTVRLRYQIAYHALTERYLVTNLNTGAQSIFPNLDAALAFVGRIDDLPAVDQASLDDDLRYDVRLRVILDTQRLPGPLRLLAFWRRDWSIGSDWKTWRLDEK